MLVPSSLEQVLKVTGGLRSSPVGRKSFDFGSDCLTWQVTMASGISMQPFPGSVGTSGHLVETLTTSPSLANQPEPPV